MGEIRAIQVSRKQKVLGQSITSGQSSRDYLHHQTRNRSHINHATTSAARLTNEALCEIAGHAVLNVVRTCPPPLYRFTVPFDTRSSLLSPCCLLLTFDLVTCDGESSVEPRKTRGRGRGEGTEGTAGSTAALTRRQLQMLPSLVPVPPLISVNA